MTEPNRVVVEIIDETSQGSNPQRPAESSRNQRDERQSRPAPPPAPVRQPAEASPPSQPQSPSSGRRQPPQGVTEWANVQNMGAGVVDAFYDGIKKAIDTTGDVPSPEAKSLVGQLWKALKDQISSDEFVAAIRNGAAANRQAAADYANSIRNPGRKPVPQAAPPPSAAAPPASASAPPVPQPVGQQAPSTAPSQTRQQPAAPADKPATPILDARLSQSLLSLVPMTALLNVGLAKFLTVSAVLNEVVQRLQQRADAAREAREAASPPAAAQPPQSSPAMPSVEMRPTNNLLGRQLQTQESILRAVRRMEAGNRGGSAVPEAPAWFRASRPQQPAGRPVFPPSAPRPPQRPPVAAKPPVAAAPEAGAAAGGLARLAAAAGPAAIAIAGTAAAVAVLGFAAKKVVDLFNEAANKAEQYSGPVAAARAQQQATQTMGDIRRSQAMGEDLARFVNLQTETGELLRDIKAALTQGLLKVVVPILEQFLDFLKQAAPFISKTLEFEAVLASSVKELFKLLDSAQVFGKKVFGAAPGAAVAGLDAIELTLRKIAKALDDFANGGGGNGQFDPFLLQALGVQGGAGLIPQAQQNPAAKPAAGAPAAAGAGVPQQLQIGFGQILKNMIPGGHFFP